MLAFIKCSLYARVCTGHVLSRVLIDPDNHYTESRGLVSEDGEQTLASTDCTFS